MSVAFARTEERSTSMQRFASTHRKRLNTTATEAFCLTSCGNYSQPHLLQVESAFSELVYFYGRRAYKRGGIGHHCSFPLGLFTGMVRFSSGSDVRTIAILSSGSSLAARWSKANRRNRRWFGN